MRGQKICPSCNEGCGPRTLKCACGHEFLKSKNVLIAANASVMVSSQATLSTRLLTPHAINDWRDLKSGSMIRVLKDSGPYMELANGMKSRIGHYGKFVVHYVDENGIHAYDNYGHSYIWMGPNIYCKKTDIHRQKHKIVILKSKSKNKV